MLRNQKGVGTMSVMFWLALVGAVIYVAIKIVSVQWDHQAMKDTMITKARVAQVLKDEEIMKDLVTKATELNLPLTSENFVIQRDDQRRKMKISTAWNVEVSFFGGLYVHLFQFAPAVEENIMSQ